MDFIFWLLLGVTLLGYVVYSYIKEQGSRKFGFKEVLKNAPVWKSSTDRQFRNIHQIIETSKGWSQEKVDTTVRDYVLHAKESHMGSPEFRILRELGDKTHSTLFSLLKTGDIQTLVAPTTRGNFLQESPFHRICALLGDHPPVSSITLMKPFHSHVEVEIRKQAAFVLGKNGSDEAIPLLQDALADQSDEVRTYALMGLQYAISGKRISSDLTHQLFPSVQRLLETGTHSEKATRVLYAFEPQKATQFFLSNQVFQAGSRILYHVLATLANARASVDRVQLLSLITELESTEMQYPYTYALGEALHLLGNQKCPQDRPFLEVRQHHPEERVGEGASLGLLACHELENFRNHIWDLEESLGFSAMANPLRHYMAVENCDSEIRNGGMGQYFLNSSGDHWEDALAGFEAIGAPERHRILQQAIDLFTPDKPSPIRDARLTQLSKVARRHDAKLDELSSRYYDCNEHVSVLLSRYVLSNADSFRC